MSTLIGYTYIITSDELADDYDDYLNQHIEVYETLKETIEEIQEYIKDNELEDDITYYHDFDEFVEENEGEDFDDTIEIAYIGDIFDSRTIIVKCVYMRNKRKTD